MDNVKDISSASGGQPSLHVTGGKNSFTVQDIFSRMVSPTPEDRALIIKAFEFAQQAHAEQKRFSGEPYFAHVLATAKNLAEFGMDANTIAAGLLHDSVEDGLVTEQQLEEEFGKEILFLVQGVTKLGKLKYRGAQRHTESLRKLFVAMAQDIRVLIIKLTDRLHNMQTLRFVPEHKRQRIALETLEIYAPLTYRLGMRKLNRELEDLAFPYVLPEEYERVKKLSRQKSKETTDHLTKTLNSLKKALAKEHITDFKSDLRVKGLYSLYRKLLRKNWDIDRVYDISAIRIIVPNIADCYRVLGVVHSILRPLPGRIKDYIAFPKPNGYRSLHTTVFTGSGGIIEVQIRTQEMHREAEYGVASHLIYKHGVSEGAKNSWASWLISLLPGRSLVSSSRKIGIAFGSIPEWIKAMAEEQLAVVGSREFMKNLKTDFFEQRVFVFTPKGDVVDLPIDSSPVDFAYAIHSDIGNHIYGAKVNGKMVVLDTALKNGDIVEILTRESSHPTPKWMDLAKTTSARAHIRAAMQKNN